ncbi:MAG: glycosyltransferase family 39 protein [Chthoniobacterales bacterium]
MISSLHPSRFTNPATTLGLGVIFAALALWSYTFANTFPAAYHPDEPSKARQVIAGEYNFHHPMLMLSAARIAVAVTGAGDDLQRVTQAGRWVSASFTAAAVFCLVVMTAHVYGFLAGFFAGAFLVTNHHLFELAHYFKEDPALLLGVSAFFLALALFDERPTPLRATFLGIGVGLAISGKYVGVLVTPVALAAIVLHRRRLRPFLALAIVLGAALVTFALANLPIVLNPAGFAGGFERELDFAVHGHKGITRAIPHGVYGAVFRESTNPIIWILLIIFALALLARWRTARPFEWMLAIFPLAFAVILSFSPKTHHRYFLPATGLLLSMAGVAVWILIHYGIRHQPRRVQIATTLVLTTLLVVAAAIQIPHTRDYFDGFSNDGRSQLAAYIRANIPPDSIIIADKRTSLRELDLPNPIEGKLFAADVGTLAELRARGITTIAVAEGDYGRFFRGRLKPTQKGADE